MCIIMLAIFLLFIASETTIAGYAGSSPNDVNGGYGYGYSGSFSGNGGNGVPAPFPAPDFEGFLGGYFDSFRKYHEQFLKTLQQQTGQFAGQNAGVPYYGIPNPDDIMKNLHKGADGSAVASASIGPGGGYQHAAVYPENSNNPNIFTRFGGTSPGGGGGGSYGVFSSSVSSSSNLNGKPQTFRTASTTINDNGKVTTYTVKDP